ncbi:MAG: acetylglutamate kinase, partial [Dehalococcoidia bacterium]|nr:acetylglutamate kinase [Dehalococcoidia bacterium]
MPTLTVVKIGGSTLSSADTTLSDLAALVTSGARFIVVHGGGKAITARLAEAGLEGRFVNGLRETSREAMPLVAEVLDSVNEGLANDLQALGVRARRFSSFLPALRAVEVPALGAVGEVTAVETGLLRDALDQGEVPLIAPIGINPASEQLLNINADTAAGEVAVATQADRMVFMTDV